MKKGEKLKEAIYLQGFSPAEFAVKLGVSESSVFKYYNKDNFDSALLEKFCSILNIPITYFFDENEFNNSTLLKESVAEYKKNQYNGAYIENISLQVNRLIETVLSQQRTIENLTQKNTKTG